jgi:branched-chain amino acid transport system substrate-binding protein
LQEVDMKRTVVLSLATAVSILVTLSPALAQAPAGEPIKIGTTGAMTGPYSEYGTGMRKAAELAVDMWNARGGVLGRPIRLVVMDDQLKADAAALNVKKLIEEEKVAAILGPSGSGPMLATVPLTEAKGVPHMNIMAQTPAIQYPKGYASPPRRNVFSVAIPNDAEAQNMVNFAWKTKGWKKIGIIHESTGYGKTGADLMVEYMEKELKTKPVGREQYDQKDTDFTAQLARLKKADAQVIISVGLGSDNATIRKEMNRLAISAPLLGSAGVISAQYTNLLGDLAVGTYGSLLGTFTDPAKISPAAKEFAAGWLKKFGNDEYYGPEKEPKIYLAIQAAYFDGANIVLDAIKRAGSTDPKAVIAALETTNYQGIIKRHTFSATKHQSITADDLDVLQYVKEGGTLVLRAPK